MLSFTTVNRPAKSLLIKTDLAQAWISYYPPAYLPRDGPDWRLRVRMAPHEPVLGRKTQTGLMIESHLRAWLLQRFRRRCPTCASPSSGRSPSGQEKTRRRSDGWAQGTKG
jgi:hypothetical protein